jgi:ubiquinone/menaquinone biosynthesis C-methylase UbiE
MEFTGERAIIARVSERVRLDHIERYQFAARCLSGMTVLDVACGSGYGSEVLVGGGCRNYIGADIDRDAIGFANRTYSAPGVGFIRADASALPLAARSVDAVVSMETIEHCSAPGAVLSEFHRVLGVGGMLIISTPNRRITSPGKGLLDPPNNRFHLMEFEQGEFLAILRASGFSVDSVWWQRLTLRPLRSPVVRAIVRRSPFQRFAFGASPKVGLPGSVTSDPRYIIIIATAQ